MNTKSFFGENLSRIVDHQEKMPDGQQLRLASMLPRADTYTLRLIPLNKHGLRIDYYMPLPTKASMLRYNNLPWRACNKYHLKGYCNDLICGFQHSYLDQDIKAVMAYHAKRRECNKGGHCREPGCIYGHHCQIPGCGGKAPCAMSPHFHNIDLQITRWVEPMEPGNLRFGNKMRNEDSSSSSPLATGSANRRNVIPNIMDMD